MRKIFLSFLIVFGAFALNVSAQTTDGNISVNSASGQVTAVSESKISLQTKDGAIDAILSSATEFKRVPPENFSLKAAVPATLAEVGIGDKVLVTGLVADDKKTMPAKAVYIVSKSTLAQKQQKDAEQWRTRGVSGRITAINPQTKEITVKTGGLMGANMIITPKTDVKFLRFPQDSVNFNDAKDSTFEELAVGDSLNAIGDKGADGATFQAEKILTGASQQIAGTITAINAEKGEITINNSQTKKDVVIVVNKNTIFLKKFPPEVAQRMAQFQTMQAQGGGNMMRPTTQGNQQNSNQSQQQNPNQTQGGGMNRGGGDFLETLPNITLADLKVGDVIGIAGSKAASLEKVTVFRLIAGVEPFLKMPQIANAGGNRQGGGGVNSNFSIPGLDGAGIP